MGKILEVDEGGVLTIPLDVLRREERPTRYEVDVQGDTLILRPAGKDRRPLWATASPQERANAFREWAASHREGPCLPDEALRRESIYD